MKNFGRVAKGGAKNFELDLFFSTHQNSIFSSVFVGFGVFLNSRSKGGRKFFNASRRGGEKFSTRREGGGEKFSTFDFLESLGKIKGHVKNLLRK